jgi:hypothetical protein
MLIMTGMRLEGRRVGVDVKFFWKMRRLMRFDFQEQKVI